MQKVEHSKTKERKNINYLKALEKKRIEINITTEDLMKIIILCKIKSLEIEPIIFSLKNNDLILNRYLESELQDNESKMHSLYFEYLTSYHSLLIRPALLLKIIASLSKNQFSIKILQNLADTYDIDVKRETESLISIFPEKITVSEFDITLDHDFQEFCSGYLIDRNLQLDLFNKFSVLIKDSEKEAQNLNKEIYSNIFHFCLNINKHNNRTLKLIICCAKRIIRNYIDYDICMPILSIIEKLILKFDEVSTYKKSGLYEFLDLFSDSLCLLKKYSCNKLILKFYNSSLVFNKENLKRKKKALRYYYSLGKINYYLGNYKEANKYYFKNWPDKKYSIESKVYCALIYLELGKFRKTQIILEDLANAIEFTKEKFKLKYKFAYLKYHCYNFQNNELKGFIENELKGILESGKNKEYLEIFLLIDFKLVSRKIYGELLKNLIAIEKSFFKGDTSYASICAKYAVFKVKEGLHLEGEEFISKSIGILNSETAVANSFHMSLLFSLAKYFLRVFDLKNTLVYINKIKDIVKKKYKKLYFIVIQFYILTAKYHLAIFDTAKAYKYYNHIKILLEKSNAKLENFKVGIYIEIYYLSAIMRQRENSKQTKKEIDLLRNVAVVSEQQNIFYELIKKLRKLNRFPQATNEIQLAIEENDFADKKCFSFIRGVLYAKVFDYTVAENLFSEKLLFLNDEAIELDFYKIRFVLAYAKLSIREAEYFKEGIKAIKTGCGEKILTHENISNNLQKGFGDIQKISLYLNEYVDDYSLIFAKLYKVIGKYYLLFGELDKSENYFEESLNIILGLLKSDDLEVAKIYKKSGDLLLFKFNHIEKTKSLVIKAKECYLKAIKINQKNKFKERDYRIIKLNIKIGDCEAYLFDFKNAILTYSSVQKQLKKFYPYTLPEIEIIDKRIDQLREIINELSNA